MIVDDSAGDIEEYANVSYADRSAAQYVSGISYHWHSNHVKKHDFPD